MELQARFNLISKSGFTDKILDCLIRNNVTSLLNDGVTCITSQQEEGGDLILTTKIGFTEVTDESYLFSLCKDLNDLDETIGSVMITGVPLGDVSFYLQDFKDNLSADIFKPKHYLPKE